MVLAMFKTDQADFGKASPDYADPGYLSGWSKQAKTFADLVPTTVRRATDKQVTKTMTQLAKSLRDPLNWLNIRLNRAGAKGGLSTGVDDFGLGKVRASISNRDTEGLDGALDHLLALLQAPANATALTAQGHAPADTKAFADARQQLATFNTTQNTNQNAALALTDDNTRAGNALWATLTDVLGTGNLMYKATNPKKARTYTAATLLKRIRKEKAPGGGDVQPTPGVA